MKQLRVMNAIDTKDPIKLGEGMADGVINAIQMVFANRPDKQAEARAFGAFLSAATGGIAGLFGNASVIEFCQETIATLQAIEAENKGPLQ